MKNLIQKYNKIELQKLWLIHYEIGLHTELTFLQANKIGFWKEGSSRYKEYKSHFSNLIHFAHSANKKLYIKYPSNILKKDYKAWFKRYYE